MILVYDCSVSPPSVRRAQPHFFEFIKKLQMSSIKTAEPVLIYTFSYPVVLANTKTRRKYILWYKT